jgi:thymidylate synthase
MHVIHARNVNDAYRKGLRLLNANGSPAPSRVGNVLKLDVPVATYYTHPEERVLFDEQRNANPFFHLFEALWMLNGQSDVATMDQFLPSLKQFSDNGSIYHGAYGYRWRHWPIYHSDGYIEELDQLRQVVLMLQRDPGSRRAVISMWDPAKDLDRPSNDIPCNDTIKVWRTNDELDMVVFNRSNDIIYGCYGANAVHLSMLQEYLAGMIGLDIGHYTQISTDYHAYLETPYKLEDYWPLEVTDEQYHDPYIDDVMRMPLVADPDTFDYELRNVMTLVHDRTFDSTDLSGITNPFFASVAQPMYQAFRLHRYNHMTSDAIELLDTHCDTSLDGIELDAPVDWLVAGKQWLTRKLISKNIQGVTA